MRMALRWLLMAEMQHKHNNQPPNWIEGESKSLCCEQQRKGLQKHNNPPKERFDVDFMLVICITLKLNHITA
jgi:hypothetical protein